MGYIRDKLKELLRKIRANKRLMYLTLLSVLVLFCLTLNITFASWSSNFTSGGANIKINDMEYIFAINSEFPELKSDIYDDHIIRIKPGNTQRYYVSITAQNKYSSKYELYYKVCQTYDENTNTCTYQDSLPAGVRIAYAYNTPNSVSGVINDDETKVIILYAENTGKEDVYLYLSMNAGYVHNELETLGAAYSQIIDEFQNPEDASFELKTIIAYANGEEVESYEFPSHGNFSLKMTCYDKDGNESQTANADGYWSGTQWVVNVNSATESTICYAKFTTTTTPIPNFQYLVNGTDVSNDQSYVKTINDGDGNWRIKFFESGIFVMTYPDVNYIDVFVVGGGGGGGGSMANCGVGGSGGGGGYTTTCKYNGVENQDLITIMSNIEYAIEIGSGGAGGPYLQTNDVPQTIYGSSGEKTSAFDCVASGGGGGYPCGTTGQSNNASGGNGGSGGGGGSHTNITGATGGTDGSNGQTSASYSSSYQYWGHLGGTGQGSTTREFAETNGDLYAGGGGGGKSGLSGDSTAGYGSGGNGIKNTGGGGGGSAGSGATGGAGGSGIVIIRNHRI